jgi:hypothetical protein
MGNLQRCWNWPDCSCHRTLAACIREHKAWKATEPPNAPCALFHIPLEMVEAQRERMYFALRCVAANCCSPKWRSNATILLMHREFKPLFREYP